MAELRPNFTLQSMESLEETPSAPPTSPVGKPLEDEKPQNAPRVFSHRFRYFILFLGCLCLTSVSSNMITLNFTLICFNPADDGHLNALNASAIEGFTVLESDVKHIYDYPTYAYTQKEKSMLLWAVAVGSIIGTFPFSWLYTRFGARYVFFGAGMTSAVSTLLIPAAADLGIYYFVGVRVFQGIAYSADFAAIGCLTARWASLKQSAVFLSILTCFTPISNSITNPVAGILCESRWGWPSVYYSHGAVCLVLFVVWMFFYSDHPSTHRSVSTVELEKIHRNKSQAHIEMNSFVPYWQIIKNPIVLTVWLNSLADIGSAIFLLTYTPTYLNQVLHYSVAHTGILGALPTMLHIPFKLLVGYLSDKIKIYTEVSKMRFFNTLALLVPGLLYLGIGFVPESHPELALFLFIGIHVFVGANCGGFYKCGVLVSRQYSAFVVANIQFIKCLSLFIAPALVAIFVTDESVQAQWRTIFIIFAFVNIASNVLFWYLASSDPAEFTNITKETSILAKNKEITAVDSEDNLQRTGHSRSP